MHLIWNFSIQRMDATKKQSIEGPVRLTEYFVACGFCTIFYCCCHKARPHVNACVACFTVVCDAIFLFQLMFIFSFTSCSLPLNLPAFSLPYISHLYLYLHSHTFTRTCLRLLFHTQTNSYTHTAYTHPYNIEVSPFRIFFAS